MGRSKIFTLHIALLALLIFGIVGQTYADPMAAKRHMARGAAAMEVAKSPADYRDAVKEFSEAVKLAPDWADAWFNLGVAQDAAEQYKAAIGSFKTYLKKAPDAPDRDAVQTRIFKLEYKAERHREEERTRESRLLEKQRVSQALSGIWRWYLGKDDGYSRGTYEIIYIEGNELIMEKIAYIGSKLGKTSRPGDKLHEQRYRLGGLDGLTLLYKDGKTAGKVNKNLKEIKIHLRMPGRPDYDYVYHKCGSLSIGSCGR